MSIFQSIVNSGSGKLQEYACYAQESRNLEPIIAVRASGSVNVVFMPGPITELIVAGETPESIASIKTEFRDGCLSIKNEGITKTFGGFTNTFYGKVGPKIKSVSGHCIVVMDGSSISFVNKDGKQIDASEMGEVVTSGFDLSKVIVCISMPEAPSFQQDGSGDITLLELNQSMLKLWVSGAGDIKAKGNVTHLVASVSGTGDIKARKLNAFNADVSVFSSGDIDVFVRNKVEAEIAGAGDITIHGNPAVKKQTVSGSGHIIFK